MPDEPARDLLRRFVQGDREAFEALFKQFQGDVYRWVLWIVRDPGSAEDVVVDAFWRAYRGRARFDASRSFGAWMRRIATNAARDHLRSSRRGSSSRWAPQQAAEEVPAAPGADRDLAEAVGLAFGKLPPKLQVVATLALIEERPYAEIADALDLPVGTIKSRVFRATRMLREELARLGIRP
jgi:RNA polymerase sigma-70 factor (ECF subfamily)